MVSLRLACRHESPGMQNDCRKLFAFTIITILLAVCSARRPRLTADPHTTVPHRAPRRRPTPLPSPPRPCIASSDHGSSCTGPGYRVGRCHNASHALKTMVNYGREYIMQWLTRASLTCVLTWLSAEVQTLTNCSELSLYFSTRLEKRNTVCSNHVNSFPSSKLICIFLQKVLFWNLLTSSA